jgi:hypothetical protein
VGEARPAPARAARPTLRLGLSVRRGLPGAQHRRRGDHARGEHRSHERAFAEISRCVSVGAIALLVLDGAGWHSSPRLNVPDNVVLLPLSPYAPELNPVENIWEFLRANFLSHRVWDTYEEILDACSIAGNKLMQTPERIASITRRSWAKPVTG